MKILVGVLCLVAIGLGLFYTLGPDRWKDDELILLGGLANDSESILFEMNYRLNDSHSALESVFLQMGRHSALDSVFKTATTSHTIMVDFQDRFDTWIESISNPYSDPEFGIQFAERMDISVRNLEELDTIYIDYEKRLNRIVRIDPQGTDSLYFLMRNELKSKSPFALNLGMLRIFKLKILENHSQILANAHREMDRKRALIGTLR